MDRSSGEPQKHLTVWRIAVYGFIMFLLAVFQTTFAARFGFFGTTPALMLALTCGAAFFEGERTGSVVGLVSGFLIDALGSAGISLLPLAYALLGWLIARLTVRFGHDRAPTSGTRLLWWSVWLAAACGGGMIITAICLLLTAGKVNIVSTILHILLPEALGTYIFGYPIGLIYIFIFRRKRA